MVVSGLTECQGTQAPGSVVYVLKGHGLIRRIVGVLARPRAIMAELVARPAWADTWLCILVIFAACGGWFLSTAIGQQALVDERVRVIEVFGGAVDDQQYAALLAQPPWWVYVMSGGRLLLTPPVTLLVALACWSVARWEEAGRGARPPRFVQALALVVHATVVLLVGQLLATPINYVRESLTSPMNLAALLPLMEEGTLPTRFFGSIDLFALWWMTLIAIGLSALSGARARRYAKWLVALYLVFAAVMSGAIAALGGS